MKYNLNRSNLARVAVIFAVPIATIPNVCAQQPPAGQNATLRAQLQEKLQQATADKARYAAAIVERWENDARASGKWDANFAVDLQTALVKLDPAHLVVAGEAKSYDAMMRVIRTGRPLLSALSLTDANGQPVSSDTLGAFGNDLVYTPVAPCRIVDTRNAGGPVIGGSTRGFDVDNPTTFAFQGGNNGPCGIPFGVASAVEMTITSTNSVAVGYFTAWAIASPQPLASLLNYTPGFNIADTAIVPVLPGSGNDFNVFSSATSDLVVDVLGYFAAPVATALDCITVASGEVSVPYDVFTPIFATCPAGRTLTGGGYFDPTAGTLGYPNTWLFSYPNGNSWELQVDNQNTGNRGMQGYAVCCQIPGR